MIPPFSGQIREWVADPTPARHLLSVYAESDWRNTRLEVLKALGSFSDYRSHRFLVDVVLRSSDFAEQDAALAALGERANSAARRFLFSFIRIVPEPLSASLASALGRARVFRGVPWLLEALRASVASEDAALLRSVVISLGELRADSARSDLRSLFDHDWIRVDRELSCAILFAWGLIERDPAHIAPWKGHLSGDGLLRQVFESALNQIEVRGQFRIEDLLSRIFGIEEPHPVLPLELGAFPAPEVLAGLEVFDRDHHWRRHLLCLKALPSGLQSAFFEGWVLPLPERKEFLQRLMETDGIQDPEALLNTLDASMPGWCDSPELRMLRWGVDPSRVDWPVEARNVLLGQSGEDAAIAFLNLWSEESLVVPREKVLADLTCFLSLNPTGAILARLYRAAGEGGYAHPGLESRLLVDFETVDLRPSVLRYAEGVGSLTLLPALDRLGPETGEKLITGVLHYLESLARMDSSDSSLQQVLRKVILQWLVNPIPAVLKGVLRILRYVDVPEALPSVLSALRSQDAVIERNAVIALKRFRSVPEATEALGAGLGSESSLIRFQSLVSLCAHFGARAGELVIGFLGNHLQEDEIVDQVFRDFHPEPEVGERLTPQIQALLNRHPDHPQWEKLVSLRDRLRPPAKPGVSEASGSKHLEALDARLTEAIPRFMSLDPTIQLALRAAEQPFLDSAFGNTLPIDRAPTVLEYCKALDLILEKYLGQKHLFPALERHLSDFQSVWQRSGISQDQPQAGRVMGLLGLHGKLLPEHFPLNKAKAMCGTFFNGRIVQDRFKVFDGLRAWAVIFLLFTRRIPVRTGGGVREPLVRLAGAEDVDCIWVAGKLMHLQDLRNPAAHRQTYRDLSSVRDIRDESVALVNRILEWVG
jgi:HEAT repeat protein